MRRSRHHNPLNPVNPVNPHTAGVSNGARQHRHLERGCMSVWEIDKNRSHDALSREISQRNAARTIRGGDFSTPLRFGRNDGRGRADFFIICGVSRHHNPRPERPSNLRTLRTFGTKSRQPSRPQGVSNSPILCITSLGTHRKFRYQRSNTIYTLRE